MGYRDPELLEIREILARYGYDPNDAERLYVEGMGPSEVEERAKRGRGAVPGIGSLEYTHRMKKVRKKSALTRRRKARRRRAARRRR